MKTVVYMIGEYTDLALPSLIFLNQCHINDVYACFFYEPEDKTYEYALFESKCKHVTFLDSPCGEEIVVTPYEKMKKWSYISCFHECKRIAPQDTNIIVLPIDSVCVWIDRSVWPKDSIGNILVPKFLEAYFDTYDKTKLDYFVVDPYSYVNESCGKYYKDMIIDDCIFPNNVFYSKDDYTIQGTDKSPLILIPSTIYAEKSRSKFTTQERFNQTLRQGFSIQKENPLCTSVLLETSNVNSLTKLDILRLSTAFTYIILFSDDKTCMQYAHNTFSNKNRTEVYTMKEVLSKTQTDTFSHISKFGGRYWFSGKECERFSSLPIMKVVNTDTYGYNLTMVEAVFYSIPIKFADAFKDALERMMEELLTNNNMDVERLLWKYFASTRNIYNPHKLEIQGYSAVSRVFRYF